MGVFRVPHMALLPSFVTGSLGSLYVLAHWQSKCSLVQSQRRRKTNPNEHLLEVSILFRDLSRFTQLSSCVCIHYNICVDIGREYRAVNNRHISLKSSDSRYPERRRKWENHDEWNLTSALNCADWPFFFLLTSHNQSEAVLDCHLKTSWIFGISSERRLLQFIGAVGNRLQLKNRHFDSSQFRRLRQAWPILRARPRYFLLNGEKTSS